MKTLDHENKHRELSDSIKCNNIQIIGVPEEEGEKVADGLLETIVIEDFPKLGKEIDFQNQEPHITPIKISKSGGKPRYIISKFDNYTDTEKILKATR